MENKKEKEKQEVEKQLSLLMEKTFKLEDELNKIIKIGED